MHALVFLAELIPLYPVYALLFADAGLTGGQISVLFGIWSLVGFVLEVPSGALADRVPRRHLLVVAQLIRAAGYASWILLPTFPGFALGFVLWGASGAASSGTWEALVYDELTRYGTADRYARVLGRAEALAAIGALAGTALAAPLFAIGGYAAAGWFSVAVCLVSAALAARLPTTTPVSADDDDLGYLATLRAGTREALRNRAVGRIVLIVVVLSGATAVEEYFSLLAVGLVAPAALPVLLLAPAIGYAVGAEAGGRLGALPGDRLAALVTGGVALFAAGALVRDPLGFVVLSVGFGLLSCGVVVVAARLQDTLAGPRATVTSVANVGEEVVALGVFAVFGVATGSVSLPVLVALSVLPVVGVALRIPRWMK